MVFRISFIILLYESMININYLGTIIEWKAVSKTPKWNSSTAEYTVYCQDGGISKYGTIEEFSVGFAYKVTSDTTCEITGIGNHSYLLENNTEYQEIYYSQMDKEEVQK